MSQERGLTTPKKVEMSFGQDSCWRGYFGAGGCQAAKRSQEVIWFLPMMQIAKHQFCRSRWIRG